MPKSEDQWKAIMLADHLRETSRGINYVLVNGGQRLTATERLDLQNSLLLLTTMENRLRVFANRR